MKYVLYMKVIHYEKIYEGWFLLNELSDSKLFEDELIQNQKLIRELANTIIRGTREKCGFPVFNIDALVENTPCSLQTKYFTFCPLPPQIENMEIVQYDNLNKLKLFNKIFENSELDDFIETFNQKNSQTVQLPAPIDSVPAAPAAVPVVSAADPVPAVIPAPADSSPQKKRKRTRITPDLIKRVADTAEQNPWLTNEKLAKIHGLSDEVLKPGKPLRLAVDRARTGNLGRHAAKPDKPFNDDN